MSSPASKTPEVPALVSVEEYLRQERAAVFKHEYFNGEVRPMAGASYAHNLICSNLAAAISQHLRGSSGRVVGSTQRAYVAAANTFCYPDLAVVQGAPEFLDETQETLLNPALLVQIVTPAPDGAWAGRFGLYRQLPGLQQFVLLHSTQAMPSGTGATSRAAGCSPIPTPGPVCWSCRASAVRCCWRRCTRALGWLRG